MSATPVYRGRFGREQAERLLWRAGFGPRPGDVDAVVARGLDATVHSLVYPGGTATLNGPDPTDGRVVRVCITGEGREILARRRRARAERLAGMLAGMSPGHRAALAAALPAMDALATARRDDFAAAAHHSS